MADRHVFFDPLYTPPPVPQVDRLPVQGATREMLDRQKVQSHIQQAVDAGRYDGPTDPIAYLRHTACLIDIEGTLIPSVAGLLCFGHQPQEILPWTYVDLAQYLGLEAISDEVIHLAKNIGGTVFDQLDYLRRYLWANTRHGMTTVQFQRVDLHEYPDRVIREVCVNMLAHRDLRRTNSQARVMFFRDRIEWYTPGGLPEGVTPENILRVQYSRNPTLQRILYEAGYGEALGQGLDTVVAILRRENIGYAGPNPVFEDLPDTFIVTVYGRSPDEFETMGVLAHLNGNQRQLWEFVRTHREVSTPQAMQRFSRSENSVLRDMRKLVELRLVEAVGNGPARRYRPMLSPSATTVAAASDEDR